MQTAKGLALRTAGNQALTSSKNLSSQMANVKQEMAKMKATTAQPAPKLPEQFALDSPDEEDGDDESVEKLDISVSSPN